jgi:hypothetical protein
VLLRQIAHEPDDGAGSGRRRVADGVADAEPLAAELDRQRVERTQGWARVVSSVTYMTGRFWLRAKVSASRVLSSRRSSVQSSAYWRM